MKHLAALGAVARPEYVARIGTRTIIALRDTGDSLQEFRVPEAAGRKIHDAGLRNEREFLGNAGYFVEKLLQMPAAAPRSSPSDTIRMVSTRFALKTICSPQCGFSSCSL